MVAVLDQMPHKGRPGVTMMLEDTIDRGQPVLRDSPIDAGDIDIEDAPRHARHPLAVVLADLLLEGALAAEQDEGGPAVALSENGFGAQPGFALAAGDRVDHPAKGPAVDMRHLVECQDRSA